MLQLIRDQKTPKFVPDYTARSLQDVNFPHLKKQGIKYIAFDADSTLVQFRGKALPPESKLFLQKQRTLFEEWCIASNRITNDLLPLAKSMDAQVVQATVLTRKPQRQFFEWVINHFGTADPSEIAMVGDKLIADMWGAKRAGLMTVWVERLGNDSIWDRVYNVRRWERRMMRSYVAEARKV